MGTQLIRYVFIFIVADLSLARRNLGKQYNPQNWTLVNGYSRAQKQTDLPYFIDSGKNDVRDVPCSNKHQEPDPPYADLCNHPCNRECREYSEPMVCRYHFQVENYLSMSKACYDCPFTKEHCFLKDCIAVDGFQTEISVINRQLPGPPIEVCQGDIVEVVVQNHMFTETTSFHWHGQHMKDYPYMDGVPMVTQCAIPPGTSFLYRFKATEVGTHFYHSHSELQRSSGLYGALIVRVPLSRDPYSDLYDYDLSDHVIIATDKIHTTGTSKYVQHHHSDGDNKPPSMLINGRGRFQEFEDEMKEVLYTPVETFTVTQGYRYRFRLINSGVLNCPIEVSVDNHTIVVISSDGSNLEPVEAASLITYAGERFDFIVDTDRPIGNYWIRFRGLMDCDERYHGVIQGAILHYEGAPQNKDPPEKLSYEKEPSGLQVNVMNAPRNSSKGLLMAEMKSAPTMRDPTLKPEADVKFYISYDFYPKNNVKYHKPNFYGFNQTEKSQRVYTPQLNHITFMPPSFPLLSTPEKAENYPFCNSSVVPPECETEFCRCTHVLRVPLDAVVELILIDKGFTYDANHPFHLHGYSFRVIGMDRIGKNVTEEIIRQMDEDGLLMRNLRNAPIKDTVTVHDGGYTIVRFHATNPGYWLFHCHIEWHMAIGMALIFKVGEVSDFPPVPENFPKCNDYLPDSRAAAMTSSANDPNNEGGGRHSNGVEGNFFKTSGGSSSIIVSPITGIIYLTPIFIHYKFLA